MDKRFAFYVIKRVLMVIPVLLGISIISFSILELTPGDAMSTILMAAEGLPAEYKAQVRADLMLDAPVYVRYLGWLTDVLRGDLGYSYVASAPVKTRIMASVAPTVQVGLLGILFSLLFSLPIGVISAVYKDSWIDNLSRGFAFLSVSIPRFWLGLMFIFVFAQLWSGWFGEGLIPSGGYVPLTEDPVMWLKHMVPPAICIGIGYGALTTRITRGSMIEELNKEYVTTARAKGVRERNIVGVHVVRNGLMPVITVVGMQLGFIINGVVVVEEVFAIPGFGRLLLQAITSQDLPMVQAMMMIIATVFVLSSLVVDITYAYLDPRVTYEEEA